MLKILSIGNSFSQDSTTYLHDLAACDNVELKVVNLYIGGCSLERHWNNVLDNKAEYNYQLNGTGTDKMVTIKDTLLEEEWDIITLQQCSGLSGLIETYHPYVQELSRYIKEHVPGATQYIHQTWAYEIDSNHGEFINYHNSQEEMYQALTKCYNTVANELALDIIPFGEVIQNLRKIPAFDYKNGGRSLCRDGFHMDFVYGRYALAATWYEYIVKGNILNNTYIPKTTLEVKVSKEELQLIRECVHKVVQSK